MGVVRLRSSLSWSVAIHLAFVLVWVAVVEKRTSYVPKNVTLIELEPTKKPDAKKTDDDTTRRIVQTTRGNIAETPAPNSFLGKRTQTVDRESVSNKQNVFGNETARPSKPKHLAQGTQARDLSKFGVAILPQAKTQETGDEPDDRMWHVGDEPLQEYVKGLKQSEKTALNTKEYVFYGYFERIRQRLDLAWTRSLREQLMKLYRGGRRLASDMDHTTKLLVTLDSGGEIVRVQVVEESGTMDLDDAAVKAFNKAGPFPNPPKGIIDAAGHVEIRWDFVLKT